MTLEYVNNCTITHRSSGGHIRCVQESDDKSAYRYEFAENRITVKNVKTGPSSEWGPNGAYACSVYFDGKRCAQFFEAGDGSEARFDIIFHKEVFEKMQAWFNEIELVKRPTVLLDGSAGLQVPNCIGIHIENLVADYEESKSQKKLCVKKTLFRLRGDQEDSWRVINNAFDARIKAFIDCKYGSAVEAILNEKFMPPEGGVKQ